MIVKSMFLYAKNVIQNCTKVNTDKITASKETKMLLNNYRNLIGIKMNLLSVSL